MPPVVAGRVETLADVMLLTKGDMAAVSVCVVVLSSLLSSLPPSLDDADGEPTCVLLIDEDGDKDDVPVAMSLGADDGDDPSVDCGGTEVDRVALPLSLVEYGDANGDADTAPWLPLEGPVGEPVIVAESPMLPLLLSLVVGDATAAGTLLVLTLAVGEALAAALLLLRVGDDVPEATAVLLLLLLLL